jgi:hypothetical protein
MHWGALPQKMIKSCPKKIFDPEHYNKDGTCKCKKTKEKKDEVQ